jgi:hypothetical protein
MHMIWFYLSDRASKFRRVLTRDLLRALHLLATCPIAAVMTKYILVSGGVVSGIGKGVIGTTQRFDAVPDYLL